MLVLTFCARFAVDRVNCMTWTVIILRDQGMHCIDFVNSTGHRPNVFVSVLLMGWVFLT